MKPRLINKNILLLLFSFVIVLVVGCNKKQSNEVRIGVIIPLTGELGTYGEAVKRGIDIAVEDVNQKKLLKGETLQVLYDDSKGESTTAVSSLQKFINIDQINLFIGDISSNVTLAILPVIDQNKVFLFSPGAATPKLTNASKLFARNWPSNNAEAFSAAEYAYNNLKSNEATIVYVNNDWGIGLKENFEKKFTELGGKIISSEIYEYGNTEFRTLIAKVKRDDPPLIYLAGNQKEMGNFMRQFRDAGIKTPVISNTSFLESDCLTIAGKASEGVIVPTPAYSPNDSTSQNIYSFYKKFKAKYNMEPSLVDANGYDAVMLIVDAYNKFGDDPIKIGEYIRNLKTYYGAGGKLSFVNGDVIVENVFKKVVNGKPEVIE
jgi:branched-chain amino acid transport system substrate-binding protein